MLTRLIPLAFFLFAPPTSVQVVINIAPYDIPVLPGQTVVHVAGRTRVFILPNSNVKGTRYTYDCSLQPCIVKVAK
jgi:hypothetical protein